MIRHQFAFIGFLLAWSVSSLQAHAQDPDSNWLRITVKAGNHDREATPVRFEVADDRLGPEVKEALGHGLVPVHLKFRDENQLMKVRFAHLERDAKTTSVRVTFILQQPLKKGGEAAYWVGIGHVISHGVRTPASLSQWSLEEIPAKLGTLELRFGDKSVFHYNAAPVSSPNYGPIQNRDAYIHPAYSPSGALVTGDFSSSHPHHRGFFLAYEKTKTGDMSPDFWNIHLGTGKIYSEGFDKPVVGPVSARFSAKHRWDAKDQATGKDVTVLREKWDVEAYDVSFDYWLFDITSTQQAVGRPLELLPYRYGGIAYRGPEPFVKGTLDVLTSEGFHRRSGDQKPARWVDLTGPIAEGSDKYAGAMIADHPSNPHYPNVARIHPTTLPFFCYVPAYDKPLTISDVAPSVFRYRVLIHDGHPDKDLDERVAHDFAEPPVVVVE